MKERNDTTNNNEFYQVVICHPKAVKRWQAISTTNPLAEKGSCLKRAKLFYAIVWSNGRQRIIWWSNSYGYPK
jgi:hypothetical protein